MRKIRKGFTLVELGVVLCIIVILMALLTPAVLQARKAVKESKAEHRLTRIGDLVDVQVTKIEGHDYVVVSTDKGVSIIHAAHCICGGAK